MRAEEELIYSWSRLKTYFIDSNTVYCKYYDVIAITIFYDVTQERRILIDRKTSQGNRKKRAGEESEYEKLME